MRRSALLRAASLCAALLLCAAPLARAASTVVISQVYGGGGNSGATLRNDFVELFNRGPVAVDVSGWSVQYASSAGSTWQRTNLSGSVPPGGYYLIQLAQGSGGTVSLPTPDATGTTAMSATAGKLVLVSDQTTIASGTVCPASPSVVDLVGFGGANCFEGVGPTPALSNTTAGLRLGGGCTDTDTNSADFATGAPSPRNTAASTNVCLAPTAPSVSGLANPASVFAGGATTLTATVLPGTNPVSTDIAVNVDLTSLGGAANQALLDDGSGVDAVAGDLVFSLGFTVPGGAAEGAYSLPLRVTDAELRQGSGAIALSVAPPAQPIHAIQGSGSISPYAGSVVTVRGIVTGRKTNGFFVQSRDGEDDGDPSTSEGLFVFTSVAPPADAAVGNEVLVTGTVQEYVPTGSTGLELTELTAPTVSLVAMAQALPAPVTMTADDTDPMGDRGQLERFEGMRVQIGSLTVTGPTDGTVNETQARSTSNGVFYAVITGIARPFREPGLEPGAVLPADAPCCIPRFDGNPERIRVDSDGLAGATRWELASGDVVEGVTGILDYGFGAYSLLPDAGAPAYVTPARAAALPAPAAGEFTVASFNLERFFDTTNDPDVSEPVLTAAAFETRLAKASLAIRQILASPDVLGLQEVENLSTLETLAARLNADAVAAGGPDPGYVAGLVEGNDPGGIDVGLLVKTARVRVSSIEQEGKDATFVNPVNGASELLNDRPPLVLRAEVLRSDGPAFPLIVVVNHLRSLNGVDDPVEGARVREKRRAQAEFLATLVQAWQSADPEAHIVVLGDMNAYEFSDGYVDSLGTIRGRPAPTDEVLLASADLVDPDLVDTSETVAPNERYSYVFEGSAQQLEHVLLSSELAPRLVALRHGRLDADFPESLRGDGSRPERLSDHDPAVAYFSLPPNRPPTASAGPDRSVVADADGNARVLLVAEAADPDGDALTIRWSGPFGEASGSPVEVGLGLGTHEVTLVVDDGRGGVVVDTLILNVLDATAPSISSVSASPAVLWPPNGRLVPVVVSVTAQDAGGAPVCAIRDVGSDEPALVLPWPLSWLNAVLRDIWITSELSLLLRAERWPWGDGRTYTIEVECADASGNSSTAQTTVLVPRHRR